MNYKWIGAILIVVCCASAGCSVAAAYRREERLLRQLVRVLQCMENELKFRLTPLPELCVLAGREVEGVLRQVFEDLSGELRAQTSPDVSGCMKAALGKAENLPPRLRRHLVHLGSSLGRYDLNGQLRGLRSIQSVCREDIRSLGKDSQLRLRSYQTLGICAGAGIVILFA